MKYILIVVIGAVLANQAEGLSDAEQELIFHIHETCMPQSGATNEMAQRAMGGDFPEEPAFKKHLLCITKTMGFMKEDGTFNMALINRDLDKRIADANIRAEILNKCIVSQGSPEETAFHSSKCMYNYKDYVD